MAYCPDDMYIRPTEDSDNIKKKEKNRRSNNELRTFPCSDRSSNEALIFTTVFFAVISMVGFISWSYPHFK